MDDAVEPRKQTGCHGSAASRHKTNQMSSTFRQISDTRRSGRHQTHAFSRNNSKEEKKSARILHHAYTISRIQATQSSDSGILGSSRHM